VYRLGNGCYHIQVRLGYMQTPALQLTLENCPSASTPISRMFIIMLPAKQLCTGQTAPRRDQLDLESLRF